MKTSFTIKQIARSCGVNEAEVKKWTRKGGGLEQYGGKVARGTLIRFLKDKGKSLGELAKPVNILLVGMNGEVGGQLASLMNMKEAVEVETVPDVATAETLMQDNTPDFILVDFSIGRTPSFEFAERLHDDEALKGIFVYGFPSAEDASVSGRWSLFAEVWKKPFTAMDLANLVLRRTMIE